MNGASPSYDLPMGLMYMIPRTKNSVVVSKMWPICVGNTRLKRITTVLLIQIEDILAQLVQNNSLKRCELTAHHRRVPVTRFA